MWDFQRQICSKISRFCEILGANFSKKQLVTTAKFVGIFWANSLEINLVCPDLMNILNFFLIDRVVTKISSCWVNTTSRRGIKRLGISFCSIFLLFSDKSSRGPLSQQPRKIPGPRLLMTTLNRDSHFLFQQQCP